MLLFHARRLPLAFLLTILGTLAAASPCAAEWHRVDSPNFVLVGDVSVGSLRDIAVRFEGFRETLGRVLSPNATGTAVPTVVLVFSSDRAFTPFKPRFQGKPIEMAGLFLGGKDVNYIAITSAAATDDGLRAVFHEYAHLLISNVSRNVPVWLNEGLAEYYSTYEMQNGGRQAVLGRAIPSHLYTLNDTSLLPLDQLLNVAHDSPLYNEGERRSVFYAQSWALTHMLLLGEPRRAPQLLQYLSKLGEGMPARDAWQQLFGADPIASDLQRYVRQRIFKAYRYTFQDKLANVESAAIPLTPADADAFLADFLIMQNRQPEAAERLAKPGGTPPTPWSMAVAAVLDASNQDDAAAERRLMALPATGDWLTAYRAGVTLAAVSSGHGSPPTTDQRTSARRLLEASRGGGHEIPNAAASLSQLELAGPEPPASSTRAALENARRLAPGRLDYVFLHARVLASQREFRAARDVLSPLMSQAYPPEIREPARSLMGYIVTVEQASASRSAAPAPADFTAPDAGPAAPPPPPAADARRSESSVMPVLREQQPGEQRVEGVLERIECASASAVFHLRMSGVVVRIAAPRMQDVDFITYRDDLKGSVGCGPLKEPMRVYVTWRPGAASTKVVVAVEFLPR